MCTCICWWWCLHSCSPETRLSVFQWSVLCKSLTTEKWYSPYSKTGSSTTSPQRSDSIPKMSTEFSCVECSFALPIWEWGITNDYRIRVKYELNVVDKEFNFIFQLYDLYGLWVGSDVVVLFDFHPWVIQSSLVGYIQMIRNVLTMSICAIW